MCGSRGGSLEGRSLWRGRETKSALRACRARRACARAGRARRHALRQRRPRSGARRRPDAGAGAIDWAIWGYAGGGTSATLTPDVRKSGRQGVRRADEHRPGAERAAARDRAVRRAVRVQLDERRADRLGERRPGRAAAQRRAAAGSAWRRRLDARQGLLVRRAGRHRSPDAEASTWRRTGPPAQLTASLSDGSAPDYVDTLPIATDIRSGIYTLTYAAGSSGQKLHVSWIETADNCPLSSAATTPRSMRSRSPPRSSSTRAADHDDGVCDAADCTLREAINAANDWAAAGGSCSRSRRTARSRSRRPWPAAGDHRAGRDRRHHRDRRAGVPGASPIDGGGIGGNGLVLAPGSDGSTIRGLALTGFRQVIIEGRIPPVRRDRRAVERQHDRAELRRHDVRRPRGERASERPGHRRHRQRQHDRRRRRRQPRLRERHRRDPDRRLRRGARQRRSRRTSSARTRPGTSLCRTTSASRRSTARCTR